MKKSRSIRATDVLLVAVSFLYLIGIRTFLSPCGPKEDGSYMTCHWAGQALTGMALLLAALSLLHVLMKDAAAKRALDLSLMAASLVTAALPGMLISLCMMNTMQCVSIMRPGTIVCAALILALAAVDLFLFPVRGLR